MKKFIILTLISMVVLSPIMANESFEPLLDEYAFEPIKCGTKENRVGKWVLLGWVVAFSSGFLFAGVSDRVFGRDEFATVIWSTIGAEIGIGLTINIPIIQVSPPKTKRVMNALLLGSIFGYIGILIVHDSLP